MMKHNYMYIYIDCVINEKELLYIVGFFQFSHLATPFEHPPAKPHLHDVSDSPWGSTGDFCQAKLS